MKVLFVCKSNVARSQMAETIFNKLTKKHSSTSAGVDVEIGYLGNKVKDTTKRIVPVMKEIGYNVSEKISKQISEEMVNDADKIIVMVEKQRCPEYLLKSKKVEFWDVADPRGEGMEPLRKARDLIKEKVEKLIDNLNIYK